MVWSGGSENKFCEQFRENSFCHIEPAALKGVQKCKQANKTEWMALLDENVDEGRKDESFKCWDNKLANLGQGGMDSYLISKIKMNF